MNIVNFIRLLEPRDARITELSAADDASLPFKIIHPNRLDCRFENMDYSISVSEGSFSKPNDATVLRITPEKNTAILLNFNGQTTH